MKSDLHLHTHFSPDCAIEPREIVRRAQEAGLECLAVTDHNSIRGALAVRELAPFQVIVAAEIRTSEGEIIGYFLEEDIPRGLSPEETIARIKEQGGLAAAPHPFDRLRTSSIRPQALAAVLPRLDILEVFNARTIWGTNLERHLAFAREHDLAPSAGSDAHTAAEIGTAYVEMEAFQDASTFLDSLRRGQVVGRRSGPLVHFSSVFTRWRRRLSARTKD